jgi:hypothetical protein
MTSGLKVPSSTLTAEGHGAGAGGIVLLTSEDGTGYNPVRTVEGRPPVSQQISAGRAPSPVLILEAKPIRGLRVAQKGRRGEPWVVSRLSLGARQPRPESPAEGSRLP